MRIRPRSNRKVPTFSNCSRTGRPGTVEQIEKLILKLAKDNSKGYNRILSELRKPGIKSVIRPLTIRLALARS